MEAYQVLPAGVYVNIMTGHNVTVVGCGVRPQTREWIVLARSGGDTLVMTIGEFFEPVLLTCPHLKLPYPNQYKPLHMMVEDIDVMRKTIKLPGLGDK